MNSRPVALELGVAPMVVRTSGEDEIRLLAKPHGVANLEVAVGAFVREVGNDDLRPLNEPHDFALEQISFVVSVDASRRQAGICDGRDEGLVANLVHGGVADLHDDEGLIHATSMPELTVDISAITRIEGPRRRLAGRTITSDGAGRHR